MAVCVGGGSESAGDRVGKENLVKTRYKKNPKIVEFRHNREQDAERPFPLTAAAEGESES